MSEVATAVQEQQEPQDQQIVQPDINQVLAQNLWGGIEAPKTEEKAPETAAQAEAAAIVPDPAVVDEDVFLNTYFQREFGSDPVAAKAEWESLRKLKETAPVVPEPEYANEESKRIHQLIKEGKIDDVYVFLDQQKKIDRLAGYDLSNVQQASEIIKTNLAFKHPELKPEQIERLYARQYTFPEQPRQGLDQTDDEYTEVLDVWKKQVQEKEQDMIIDATLAKPELLKQKNQIVLPDIQSAPIPNAQASQEDLAAQEAFRNGFIQKLNADYKNFNGYNVTAKDGEVELPISYTINDDEKLAFNATVQKAVDNINTFLDNDLKWWNEETKSFNINKMQEDLYLLMNRDKIHQKIANEASAKRFDHHLKLQNNIKLNGVNQEIAPAQVSAKTESQIVAENIWKL